MSIEIDIQTADAAWPAAKPLLEAIWPADTEDPIQRAKPDFRILVESLGDGVVSHVGIFRRTGLWKGRKVQIGGVGQVATYPDHRRQGYAGLALRGAVQTFRDEEVVDFGLLFCEPGNAPFFETRGWHKFDGGIQTEQNGERVRLESLTPYVFDLRNGPREGVIDIRGLPW